MNERNGATPEISAARGGGSYLDNRLRMLAERLERRGLEARLVLYPVNGIKGERRDVLRLSNPSSPERGVMVVGKDGCVTWEYSGTLDDIGIDKIAGEAINALRATGAPRQGRTSW